MQADAQSDKARLLLGLPTALVHPYYVTSGSRSRGLLSRLRFLVWLVSVGWLGPSCSRSPRPY
jgi:hypothetical protein